MMFPPRSRSAGPAPGAGCSTPLCSSCDRSRRWDAWSDPLRAGARASSRRARGRRRCPTSTTGRAPRTPALGGDERQPGEPLEHAGPEQEPQRPRRPPPAPRRRRGRRARRRLTVGRRAEWDVHRHLEVGQTAQTGSYAGRGTGSYGAHIDGMRMPPRRPDVARPGDLGHGGVHVEDRHERHAGPRGLGLAGAELGQPSVVGPGPGHQQLDRARRRWHRGRPRTARTRRPSTASASGR